MFEYELHSIPIVIGSTVVGIVTWRDLLRTLVPDDDVIRAESHQPAEDLCRR
jgi:CBS domain-containing protein